MATFYLTRSVVRSARIATSSTFDFGALPAELRYRILSLVLDDSPIQLAMSGKQAFIPLNIRLVSKTFSADLIKVLETWTPPTDMTWRIIIAHGIEDIHDHAQSIIQTLLNPYRSPTIPVTLAHYPPPHHIELAIFHPAAFAQLGPAVGYLGDWDPVALRYQGHRHRTPNFSRMSAHLMRYWRAYMALSKIPLHSPYIRLTLDLTLPRAARHLPWIDRRFWDESLHTVLHNHDAGPQGDRCERCAGVALVGTLRQEDWTAIETVLENWRRGFVRVAGGGLRLTGEDVPPPRRPREMSLGQLRVEVATVDTWMMYAIGVVVAVVALFLGLELIGR